MPSKERWAKMTDEQKEIYRLQTNKWRKQNPEKWLKLVQKSYFKQTEGKVSRRNILNRSEEDRRVRALEKANQRCSRAKKAKFEDELTQLVTSEAHKLRVLRNSLTGIEWHVDHIFPLRGKDVCGLHIWNNLQVIPKILNLRKGAKNPLHEKWSTQLQAGV